MIKRKYPFRVGVYFIEPEDIGLYKSMQVIAKKSRLSLSSLALILIERGLPQVEESLKVIQVRQKVRRAKPGDK